MFVFETPVAADIPLLCKVLIPVFKEGGSCLKEKIMLYIIVKLSNDTYRMLLVWIGDLQFSTFRHLIRSILVYFTFCFLYSSFATSSS